MDFQFFYQALEVIKKLKEVMPIDRAKMKLRVTTNDEGAVAAAAVTAVNFGI